MAEIQLRAARPTLDEGRFFATYLNAASGGLMRLLFGRKTNTIIARAYLSPGHDMSFENVVFTTQNGEIVGMAAGYSAQIHRQSTLWPLTRAAGLRGLRPLVLSALGYRLLNFVEQLPESDFYLQAIAVSPEHRGKGIGSILLQDVEKRALAAGCTRLALDVDIKNDKARRLYERTGMTIESQSPPLPLMRDSGVYRMVRALNA